MIFVIRDLQKPFICQCCQRQFTQRHSLERHIKNIHKEIKYIPKIINLYNLKKIKEKEIGNNKTKADLMMKNKFKF